MATWHVMKDDFIKVSGGEGYAVSRLVEQAARIKELEGDNEKLSSQLRDALDGVFEYEEQ